MSREEERNTIAHKIAWEYTKHYDPLLSKESWCEMAARDAIDWFDQHPREGLWDSEKVIEWLKVYTDDYFVRDTDDSWLREDDFIRDLRKAMED